MAAVQEYLADQARYEPATMSARYRTLQRWFGWLVDEGGRGEPYGYQLERLQRLSRSSFCGQVGGGAAHEHGRLLRTPGEQQGAREALRRDVPGAGSRAAPHTPR